MPHRLVLPGSISMVIQQRSNTDAGIIWKGVLRAGLLVMAESMLIRIQRRDATIISIIQKQILIQGLLVLAEVASVIGT